MFSQQRRFFSRVVQTEQHVGNKRCLPHANLALPAARHFVRECGIARLLDIHNMQHITD